MSKNDIARITDEVGKLDERDRKKVFKAIKKMVRGETGSADAPTAETKTK